MNVARGNSMLVMTKKVRNKAQQGWLLLAVMGVLLVMSYAIVMLMAQSQLQLRSIQQAQESSQDRVSKWPPVYSPRGQQ